MAKFFRTLPSSQEARRLPARIRHVSKNAVEIEGLHRGRSILAKATVKDDPHGLLPQIRPGDLILAEFDARGRHAKIMTILSSQASPDIFTRDIFTRLAIHTHDLPEIWPEDALAEAAKAKSIDLGEREDLRALPLITLDGASAQDFDDAVYARPTPEYPGGHCILVAIADVAHYVHPSSALDREAYRRGNSVYFPKHTLPMLPKRLSHGLCSLMPGEDRACLAVEIIIDAKGHCRSWRFLRGLMRSAARLTYDEAEIILGGQQSDTISQEAQASLKRLAAAWQALRHERSLREPLTLDSQHVSFHFDDKGRALKSDQRPRLHAEMLIEDFMIAANVCAAKTLTEGYGYSLYRAHPSPEPDRLRSLKLALAGLGLPISKPCSKPSEFNRIIKQAPAKVHPIVQDLILRTQQRAFYSADHDRHYGLCLDNYVHFTSPIRRYMDLIVHRALIKTLNLGKGGQSFPSHPQTICNHLSFTEHRADIATRAVEDRYLAFLLSQQIGDIVDARIIAVLKAGLILQPINSAGEGFLPRKQLLPRDHYHLDQASISLIGQYYKRCFQLGHVLTIQIKDVDPIANRVLFDLSEEDQSYHRKPRHASRKPRQRRPRQHKV